jgi:hypothetical protein
MKRKTILKLAGALEPVQQIRSGIRSVKKNIDEIKELGDLDEESYLWMADELDKAIVALKRANNSLYGMQSKVV